MGYQCPLRVKGITNICCENNIKNNYGSYRTIELYKEIKLFYIVELHNYRIIEIYERKFKTNSDLTHRKRPL